MVGCKIFFNLFFSFSLHNISHRCFSCIIRHHINSVWIVYPPDFFAIFDDRATKEASYSKQFFQRQNDGPGRPSWKQNKTIQEAAFSLLEWAQYGTPLEELIDNYNAAAGSPKDNDSEEEGDVIVDDDKGSSEDQEEEEEETMPEWAQDVVNQNHATKEMETPSKMKVDLRPYQKQALHWMMEREKDLNNQNSSKCRQSIVATRTTAIVDGIS